MLQTDRGPSVLGEFVLAHGAGARAWLEKLDDFTVVTDPAEPMQVAVSGAASHGRAGGHAGRVGWVAQADLVEGSPDEVVAALDGGSPQRKFRGRFACVAWNPDARRAVAITDHFSSVSLFALVHDGVVALATDLRLLAKSPWCQRQIDLES